MSRSLVFTLLPLWLGLTAGCSVYSQPPVEVQEQVVVVEVVTEPAVREWLDLQEKAAALTPEEARLMLAERTQPEGGTQLFYFGLLSQQSQTYEGWIKARDIFRQLHNEPSLNPRQGQMAGLLEVHNQQRINWYQHYLQEKARSTELALELAKTEQEKMQLQQKIQALTELEAQISTRKDQ